MGTETGSNPLPPLLFPADQMTYIGGAHLQAATQLMSNRRITGVVLLVVGVILLYFGWQATETFGEQVRETITGDYSDRTMWYLVGGAAAVVGGLLLALFGRGR